MFVHLVGVACKIFVEQLLFLVSRTFRSLCTVQTKNLHISRSHWSRGHYYKLSPTHFSPTIYQLMWSGAPYLCDLSYFSLSAGHFTHDFLISLLKPYFFLSTYSWFVGIPPLKNKYFDLRVFISSKSLTRFNLVELGMTVFWDEAWINCIMVLTRNTE